MHQSVQKQPPRSRDREVEFDVIREQVERRLHRGAGPKARKLHRRDDDAAREPRGERPGNAP